MKSAVSTRTGTFKQSVRIRDHQLTADERKISGHRRGPDRWSSLPPASPPVRR